MKKEIKIGLIVADEHEYAPVEKFVQDKNIKIYDFYKNRAIDFTITQQGKTAYITAVLCGIGKVNAASAAAMLIAKDKADILINFGLSGIVSDLKKGDIAICKSFIEHDFDITPFGYKPAQKPQETYCYKADQTLLKLFVNLYPFLKSAVAVTGDQFICDKTTKDFLKNEFSAQCCDMESAAIASVCHQGDIPFVSLRKMSDDADETATMEYRELNFKQEDVLFKITLDGIKKLLDSDDR
ncbi:MAG: hypothetical protein BGN88_07790 [Clostridiales bacterium 43-6]|nr:MAG: hypothetical protein BGN88_07790 [Clostridiales bacterium 43-6]